MKPDKKCKRCSKTIKPTDKHWNDVPNVGDLCPPCHDAWLAGETTHEDI